VVYSDKLSQYKIGGPSKPFIDQNLQLQLPEWDPPQSQTNQCHSPIYSHYVGSSPSFPFSLQINEAELYHAITEAERSYESWKQMQQKLQEAVKAYRYPG
jgi:hypothetical protein